MNIDSGGTSQTDYYLCLTARQNCNGMALASLSVMRAKHGPGLCLCDEVVEAPTVLLSRAHWDLHQSVSDSEPLQQPAPPGSTNHQITATMSADSLERLASAGKGESTRTLLRVIILLLVAGAAISSRLFSVIRKPPGLQLP